jgi:hypothetical protein
MTFNRHIDTGLVIGVVVPCAINVAESAGILCKEKQDISEGPAAIQYENMVNFRN